MGEWILAGVVEAFGWLIALESERSRWLAYVVFTLVTSAGFTFAYGCARVGNPIGAWIFFSVGTVGAVCLFAMIFAPRRSDESKKSN